MALQLITTSDGSHSLLNTALNETYHSVHGALQESQHVFIRHGLEYWHGRNAGKEARILEIGFGTGLNALLTLLYSNHSGIKIFYESWDIEPLAPSLVQQLNYGDILDAPDGFSKIHDAPWNEPTFITPTFALHKHHGDILKDPVGSPGGIDLIYYDAFAPGKQPEMWTTEILKKVSDCLAPGGVWVTYCAKGQVKRDLKSFGLTVETLPGPPGKKEMIRASR